jgi:uncharacterized protein (DUF58 family)
MRKDSRRGKEGSTRARAARETERDRGPSTGPRPVERSVESTPRPARAIPAVGAPAADATDRVMGTEDLLAVGRRTAETGARVAEPATPPRPRRRRKRRGTAPTRDGWWFLAATLVVGVIAVDAGLNLFFLLFGTMVCLLAAGIALSELGLSGLRVRRVLPTAVHAGTPYLMGISLENRKRRVPSFSIEVEDLVDGEPIDKRCYFLKLPSLRTQETAYRHTPPRRGRHRLTGFRLVTKFPFGLIQRAREIADPAELIVYPALILPPVSLVRALPARPGAGRDRARSRQGEFAGLRAYRDGDDARDIHWRSSARRGIPLVREHEDEEAQQATVVFDNDPEGTRDPAAFERAVSEAAGLCVELLHRGFSVGLVMRGGEVTADVGPAQADKLLRALALVAPDTGQLRRARRGATVRISVGRPPRLEMGAPRNRRAGVAGLG